MSSSKSGLPDVDDPMAIGSGASEPEILTSDTESDPEMMSDDNDDFQPFALPNLGDDTLTTDGIPDEDPFAISIPVHDHLIIDHPDGEHVVSPILSPVPLVAIPLEGLPSNDLTDVEVDLLVDGPFDDTHDDERLDEDTVTIPLLEIPVVEISPDTSLHSVPDSFEFVTSSALQAPVDVPADPKPLPNHDPIPFDIPDIAPLIPDLAPSTIDPPVIGTFVSPPAPTPTDAAPYSVESEVHHDGLPIDFLQNIPAPLPGKDTSGH
ncbi:hypothetical protein Hanom_Chr08g00751521 [Helianthus anomalus]